jgi:lipoate synthase
VTRWSANLGTRIMSTYRCFRELSTLVFLKRLDRVTQPDRALGLIVGMGETREEVLGTVADTRAVGIDVITIGQYLRPTAGIVPSTIMSTPTSLLSTRGSRRGSACLTWSRVRWSAPATKPRRAGRRSRSASEREE